MEKAAQRENGQAMILFCVAGLLACSAAEFLIVVSDALVSAHLGSAVILPCALSPPLNARHFDVRWYRNGDYDNLILLYRDQNVSFGDERYSARASLIGELDKGNVSLKLDKLTVVDAGDYTCLVKSISWYEKGSMKLDVKVLGSTPLLSYHDAGDKLNVTCVSGGWSPKPRLTWRASTGQELPSSHTDYRTDSEGFESVSSWLLVSPADSEWISCTVGLNHAEKRESRIVALKGFWKEAFISTLVLSLLVLVTSALLLLLFRKGLLPHCSSHRNANAAADSLESFPAEMILLNAPESRVSLKLDPSTADRSLVISRDRKRVSCEVPRSVSDASFPSVVSKEELGSGRHYWEVLVWDKVMTSQQKSSWCVGVSQKASTENVLRALCYERGVGLYPNTDRSRIISTDYTLTTLGLLYVGENMTLSFYNVHKASSRHLHTFSDLPSGAYFAFFSPGVKDKHPVTIRT